MASALPSSPSSCRMVYAQRKTRRLVHNIISPLPSQSWSLFSSIVALHRLVNRFLFYLTIALPLFLTTCGLMTISLAETETFFFFNVRLEFFCLGYRRAWGSTRLAHPLYAAH